MAEDNNKSTENVPFEEFVKTQFELVFAKLDKLELEMVDRFLQLSRQVRHLDQKVDIFIQEQIYLKDEMCEIRKQVNPAN